MLRYRSADSDLFAASNIIDDRGSLPALPSLPRLEVPPGDWDWVSAAPPAIQRWQNAHYLFLRADAEDPGRVDSPPISRMSAPSSAICQARFTAAFGPKKRPLSEKESGVTFKIPMTSVLSPNSRTQSTARSVKRLREHNSAMVISFGAALQRLSQNSDLPLYNFGNLRLEGQSARVPPKAT
jgi:hypothetical protein